MDQQFEDEEEKNVSFYETIYNQDNSENINGEKNKPPKSSTNTITEKTKEKTKKTNTENIKENKNKTETSQKETKEINTQNNQEKSNVIIKRHTYINKNKNIKDIRNNINLNIKEKADYFNQNKCKTVCENLNNNISLPQSIKDLDKSPETMNYIGNKGDKDETIQDEMNYESNKDNN